MMGRKAAVKNKFSLGVKQVKDEITIMQQLDHPNLVELYDVIEGEEYLHLVLEYIPHGSIAPITQPITTFDTIRIYMRDLFMGLNHLHSKRIAHGDIKPENILLGNDGHLRLSDFGVSRHFKAGDKSVVTGLETTPAYQAPEELKGNYRPWPADVWALGVVMFEFLTGMHPFLGNTQHETYNNIETLDPELPHHITMDRQNTGIVNFLFGCIEKDPKDRITMDQIKQDPWLCAEDPWTDRLEVTNDIDQLFSQIQAPSITVQSEPLPSISTFASNNTAASSPGGWQASIQFGAGRRSTGGDYSDSLQSPREADLPDVVDKGSDHFVDEEQVEVITKKRGFYRIRSKDGSLKWVGGESIRKQPRQSIINQWKREEKIGRVKVNPFLQDWEAYGNKLAKIRKTMRKIAKAQRDFSEKVDRVIKRYNYGDDVGVELHNSSDELLSTFTSVFSALQVMARMHRDCGNYLEKNFENQMSALQKKDSDQIKTNKKKFNKAESDVESSLRKVEEKHKGYRDLLKQSRKMAEPGWKPKAKNSFFGGKKEPEPSSVIIARTHAELLQSEEDYYQAVKNANKTQEYRERVVEQVKGSLSEEQMARIKVSSEVLLEIVSCMGQIVDSNNCRDQLNTLRERVATLDVQKDIILEKTFDTLIEKFGDRLPPEHVAFHGEGWKNVFVSLEDAMIKGSYLSVPKILKALCGKVEALGGFQTVGIFRKPFHDDNARNELRRQLLRGDYEIHSDDPHLPAALLKDWLRGIKEPIIPFSAYDAAILAAKRKRLSEQDFGVFMKQLDPVRRDCLIFLVKFFRRLLEHSRVTKTDVKCLGTIFAPSLLQMEHLSAENMRANASFAKTFLVHLIQKLPVDPELKPSSTNPPID